MNYKEKTQWTCVLGKDTASEIEDYLCLLYQQDIRAYFKSHVALEILKGKGRHIYNTGIDGMRLQIKAKIDKWMSDLHINMSFLANIASHHKYWIFVRSLQGFPKPPGIIREFKLQILTLQTQFDPPRDGEYIRSVRRMWTAQVYIHRNGGNYFESLLLFLHTHHSTIVEYIKANPSPSDNMVYADESVNSYLLLDTHFIYKPIGTLFPGIHWCDL